MDAVNQPPLKKTKTLKERQKDCREKKLVAGGRRSQRHTKKKEASDEATKGKTARDAAEKKGLEMKGMSEEQIAIIWNKKEEDRKLVCERTRKSRATNNAFLKLNYIEMRAAAPAPGRRCDGFQLLQKLDDYIQTNSQIVKEEFQRFVPLESKSRILLGGIQRINGNRYEIFANDKSGKGTGVFDWLLSEVEKEMTKQPKTVRIPVHRITVMRQGIIAFANGRAWTDKRLRDSMRFHNHAFIINFGKCKQQDILIDLDKKEHFQFGLLCTDNVYATKE